MAFLGTDPNQDPNNPQNNPNGAPGQGGAAAPGGAPMLGGQSGMIGGGAPGAAADSGPKGTSSGNFTNLQNYVTANQGNDTAMGQAVTNTVGAQAQGADAAGASFQQTGQKAVDSGTVKEDPNLITSLDNAKTGVSTLGNVDSSAFNTQYNAKYGGPDAANKVAGYDDANAKFAQTQDEARKAASTDQADRAAVLGDTYGKGGAQYGQGQKTLDSFLLGSTQASQDQLTGIGQKYGDYSGNFSKLSGAVDDSIAKGKAVTDQTKNDVQMAARDATSDEQVRLDIAAAQAAKANKDNGATNTALAGGDVTALKKAGYSDDAIKFLQAQGGNFGSYTSNGAAYGTSDFARKEDVSNFQQLQNLLKGAGSNLPTTTYDFATHGGAAGGAKAEDVKAANDLAAESADLNKRLADQNNARGSDYSTAVHSLDTTADYNILGSRDKALAAAGLTNDDYNAAKAAGINLDQYLKQGNNLGLGDVASGDEQAQYTKLSQLLGLTPNTFGKSGGGADYSFDKNGFQQALTAKQAAQQAALAKQQVASAPPPAAAGAPGGWPQGPAGDSNKGPPIITGATPSNLEKWVGNLPIVPGGINGPDGQPLHTGTLGGAAAGAKKKLHWS